MENRRNSNIELLRCICMYGVVAMHVLAQYREPSMSLENNIMMSFVMGLFACSVPIFMMISGFYGMKFRIKKFVKFEINMIICSVVSYLTFTKTISVKELVYAFCPLYTEQFWFMSVYMILMVLSPFITMVVNKMEKQQLRMLILLLVVIYDVIPFILNRYLTKDGGNDIINMLIIYLIGAYMKRYMEFDKNRRFIFCGTIGLLSITVALTCIYEVVRQNGAYIRLVQNQSPIVIILSMAIFYLVIGATPQCSQMINRFSRYMIYIYLCEPFFRNIVIDRVGLDNYVNCASFPIYVLLVITVVFICSWMAGVVLDGVVGFIVDRVIDFMKQRKLDKYIKQYVECIMKKEIVN